MRSDGKRKHSVTIKREPKRQRLAVVKKESSLAAPAAGAEPAPSAVSMKQEPSRADVLRSRYGGVIPVDGAFNRAEYDELRQRYLQPRPNIQRREWNFRRGAVRVATATRALRNHPARISATTHPRLYKDIQDALTAGNEVAVLHLLRHFTST